MIDAVWSIGVRYSSVERVLDAYLNQRGLGGLEASQACLDGPTAFLQWVGTIGSPSTADGLAESLGNRQRTSTRGGALKAEAVLQAFQLLTREGIEKTADLLANEERLEELWRKQIIGQKSGISWKYLLMLAGKQGVKPDRMVHRFMKRMGVPADMTPERFVQLVVETIDDPSMNAREVDHRIWSIERSRSPEELSSIEDAVEEFVRVRDWQKFHSVKNLVLALVSEIGEVADVIRWKTDDEVQHFLAMEDGRKRLGEELADVFIFLIRTAQMAGIDLSSATLQKIALNDENYPVDLSKGNAQKHDELARE